MKPLCVPGGETARLLHSAYTQHPRKEDAACDSIIDRLLKIKRKRMEKLLLVCDLSCLDISLMNIPQPEPLPGETQPMPYVLVADDAFLLSPGRTIVIINGSTLVLY